MVRRFNLGVFYDLWPPFWPTYNQKMKKRKVDSSATFLRRIQICFQKRKIPILKFWPPIGGPLVTPWPLTSVVESSPTLFWPSKSVRWKVRTLSLMYFLCMSQFQKKTPEVRILVGSASGGGLGHGYRIPKPCEPSWRASKSNLCIVAQSS